MQANGSLVQLQANASPDHVQANISPDHVRAIQNWQNWQNTSKENVKENAKEIMKKKNAIAGKCVSSLSSNIKRKSNDICLEIVTW